MKNVVYHFFIAAITAGSKPFTLLTDPSNHSSPKNSVLSNISVLYKYSLIRKSIAAAMGRSNCVPTFLISDGARLSIILCGGSLIARLRKVARRRSLDSLIAASGSQMISIVGIALLLSASIVISNHSSPNVVNVLTRDCGICFCFGSKYDRHYIYL